MKNQFLATLAVLIYANFYSISHKLNVYEASVLCVAFNRYLRSAFDILTWRKIEIEPLRWSQNCLIDIYESMTVRSSLCSQRNLGSIIAEHNILYLTYTFKHRDNTHRVRESPGKMTCRKKRNIAVPSIYLFLTTHATLLMRDR